MADDEVQVDPHHRRGPEEHEFGPKRRKTEEDNAASCSNSEHTNFEGTNATRETKLKNVITEAGEEDLPVVVSKQILFKATSSTVNLENLKLKNFDWGTVTLSSDRLLGIDLDMHDSSLLQSEEAALPLQDIIAHVEAGNYPTKALSTSFNEDIVYHRDFIEAITRILKTVQTAIDKEQYIVIFHALPSVGKSMLAWYLADILCRNGSTVRMDTSELDNKNKDWAAKAVQTVLGSTNYNWGILDQVNLNVYDRCTLHLAGRWHRKTHGRPLIFFTSGHYPPDSYFMSLKARTCVTILELKVKKDFVTTAVAGIRQIEENQVTEGDRETLVQILLEISERAGHIIEMVTYLEVHPDLLESGFTELKEELVSYIEKL